TKIEGGPSAEGACSDYGDVRFAGHLVFSRLVFSRRSTAMCSQRQNCAHPLSPRRQQRRGDSQLTGSAARKPGSQNAIRRGRLFFRHGSGCVAPSLSLSLAREVYLVDAKK